MIKESFIGRPISHFNVNPLVEAFIISETFIWSSFYAIIPIFAIFFTRNVAGGSVELAASAYSVHLITRVISELLSAKFLVKREEVKKLMIAIIGTVITSGAYIGFSFTNMVFQAFIFYAVAGVGLGIASPAKMSLFSTHLDKNQEAKEWGFYDALVFIGMALTSALGGFIANSYGFRILFIVSTVLTWIGILPYFLYLKKNHHRKS